MILAFGLPHFGQTSRWGAVTFGVLLRFWRRSVGIDSECISVVLIICQSQSALSAICTVLVRTG